MREGPGWEAFWNRRMQGGGCGRRPEAGVGRAALSLDVWAAAGLPGPRGWGIRFDTDAYRYWGPRLGKQSVGWHSAPTQHLQTRCSWAVHNLNHHSWQP